MFKTSTEIHNVDTLETYPRILGPITPEDLLSKLPKPRHDYFLVSPEGLLIDPSQPPPVSSMPSTLFLFKKSSVDIVSDFPKPNPDNYILMPPYKEFKEAINFGNYHNIIEPYDRIQTIDKGLFSNYFQAKKHYSNFLIHKELFNKAKLLAKIRHESSNALRLNVSEYFMQRFKEFEVLKEGVEVMNTRIFEDSKNFKEKIANLQRSGVLTNVVELIQQSLRGYGPYISEKARKFYRKVQKIDDNFQKVRTLLDDSGITYEKVKYTVEGDLSGVERREVFETDFTDLINILLDYKTFRETFSEAEDAEIKQQAEKRQKCANKMLEMEENVERGKKTLINFNYIMQNFTKDFNKIQETIKRIQSMYKSKLVENFVKATQLIKYSWSEKQIKLWRKFRKINQEKEFLTIPDKLEEACIAADNEEKRSKLKMMEIQELYISLSQGIIKDYCERQDFLKKFGAMLPKEMCSGLADTVINRSYLRQLVKMKPHEELPENRVRELPKEELIRYYEGRLASLEQNYSREVNMLKSKEKKLQDHYVYLLGYKEKISKDVAGQENLLRKYLEQLAVCRNKNASEVYARKFQHEVERLKEKEKAFKAIHLLNLRSLISENDRLRSNNSESFGRSN